MIVWLQFAVIVCASAQYRSRFIDVQELAGEPDYRSVRLKWRYNQYPEPRGFSVRVCEVGSWSTKTRCIQRHLSMSKDEVTHDVLLTTERGTYEAVLNDLRMTTNYTFGVEPDLAPGPLFYSSDHEDTNLLPPKARSILLTTKGFTARASRCLSNTSDVVVNTGPYFNGKISVEDALDPQCAVNGNRSSETNVYTLTINHDKCGSRIVNNSRIESNIIVHENRDIVTHNSKRFLVVCRFVPQTFTITASVNLPRRKKLEKSETNEIFAAPETLRQNHVRDSRILAEQSATLRGVSPDSGSHVAGHMVMMVLLVMAGVVGCAVAIWWFTQSSERRKRDPETISMAESYVTVVSENPESKSKTPDLFRANLLTFGGAPMALMNIKPIGDSEV